MQNYPLVSVIIPAYNHEKYVQDTIQSIIDQAYQNIELIIVDDGSKDTTFAKIQQMKELCDKRFVRFVAQTQENQGTCLTLNKLLKLTQGEYIYLIASDDKATPDAIKTLYDFLSVNNDYALVVGENLFIDENSKQCYWNRFTSNTYDINEAFFTSFSDYLMKIKADTLDFLSDEFGSYQTLIKGNYIPNGYLIRKSIFEKTGYFKKEAPLEDYYLMLQISKYAKMKYIAKPLFYYRWHNANTSLQDEKLQDLINKTLSYEIQTVMTNGDAKIKNILQDYLNIAMKEAKEAAKDYKQKYINVQHKISILLPVYNGEKYLEETLNSILSQSFKEYEVICINDSSTDSSLKVLNFFAKKDARIKILQKTNGGTAVKSLIHGLPYAKGDYMFYMSQDDLMTPDLLEKMYKKAIESDADAVIPDMAWYHGPQENYSGISGVQGRKDIVLSGNDAFVLSLGWTIHGFSLRKMDLVKKLGYDDIAMNSDEYMTRLFYLNSNKIVFSDGAFLYRQNNENAITKKVTVGTFEYIITNNRIVDLIIEANCNPMILEKFIVHSINYIKVMKDALSKVQLVFSTEDYSKAQSIVDDGYNLLKEKALKFRLSHLFPNIENNLAIINNGELVSVIIPAYNHEKYVQETIQSIIDQTYENIELIIIDDGSKDSTFAKIQEMKELCDKRFVRFVTQTQDNQGTCTTLNKLLELAQGEYVYLIASDDKAASNAIATLYSFLSVNPDYVLAVGENLLMDENSKQCYWDNDTNIVYDLSQAIYSSFTDCLIKNTQATNFFTDEFGSYPSLIMGNYVPNGYLIRKSIYDRIGGFSKEAPLEDYYLMLQVAKYGKMKYLQYPLFYYRWHGANTVRNSKKMKDMEEQTRLYEIQSVITGTDQEAILRLQKSLDVIKNKIASVIK